MSIDWLQEFVDRAPKSPGVYRFWSANNQVLYVGKANDIRKRLTQYRSGRESEQRVNIHLLLKNAVRLDWSVTSTEREALLLEDTQIKEYRPRYNIRMRDDKTYVHLRLSIEHDFPRLLRIRRPKGTEKDLFGPYPSSWRVKQVQQMVHKVFPIRTCNDSKFGNRLRPCLEHQIGRCAAPCVGKISTDEYGDMIQEIREFLKGNDQGLVQQWKEKMETASQEMRFEDAARYRDLVQASQEIWERQVVDLRSDDTCDAIAVQANEKEICFAISMVERGRLRETQTFGPFKWQGDIEQTLSQFVLQYYSSGESIPGLLLLNEQNAISNALIAVLQERRGKKVEVRVPQRGKNRSRLELAVKHAQAVLSGGGAASKEVEAVQKTLKIPDNRLERVECYDISEHHGDAAVGAQVVFLFGEPAKDLYRKYKIRYESGEDDFAKMYEMISRRARSMVENKDAPDLIVIDGGKGQLNAALRAFEDLEVEAPLIVGLAKARDVVLGQERSVSQQERIFFPKRSNPVVLKPGSAASHYFERIRNETHRFAIGYHRSLRQKNVMKGIERIPGVGAARRKQVLNAYNNLAQLRYESSEEIAEKAQIPVRVAENIVHWIHNENTTDHESM